MRCAVWIVFQTLYFRRDTVFVALEVNNTVMLLVTATDVTHGNAASAVTATSSFLGR